ncbi:hypothetical protein Tco_0950779 [Tanacetum coccineum]
MCLVRECWTGLHEMAMAAFESQYIGPQDFPSDNATDADITKWEMRWDFWRRLRGEKVTVVVILAGDDGGGDGGLGWGVKKREMGFGVVAVE